MNLPSVKTLSKIAHERAGELRKVLELTTWADLFKLMPHKWEYLWDDKRYNPNGETKYLHTQCWVNSCYNRPSFHEIKMALADEILETCGVEYQAEGRGVRSPAFEYCNAGDTYAATLLFVKGRYRVGCWGDIVERGDYD